MSLSPSPPRATAREWTGLAVVALPCLVYSMDLTVLNLALPVLSRELQPSGGQLLWILDIYGFFVAGFLITMGTLGDRIGRRRLLLIGAAFFAGASALAALADTAALLIAARALLGLAGATIAPSTMALIRNMFHDAGQRQFAIGIWIAAFSLGSAIGPLVGGVLLEYFHWGSVFWINVPVMALTLALGPRLLPEYRDPQAGRLDLASVALSLAAVLLTIYGLKQMAEHGPAAGSLATTLLGLAVGALFVRRQGRIDYPLLDVRLFAHAPFCAALAAYALTCLAMFGVYIFITQYLQLVLGLTPLHAGLATLPWALSFVAGSLLAPTLAARWPRARVLVVGLVAAALGFGLLAAGQGLWTLLPATVVMALGMAPVFTIGNEIIITTAPPERAGAASALSETASEFSGALGIALLGSAGMVVYRHGLASAWPTGLGADAVLAAGASLGGAVHLAQVLPSAQGAALLQAAQGGFTDALQAIALVGALLVGAAAWLVARMLRGVDLAAAPH
ncbi:MFS transporter [Pseudorhodoferax soli]|uniref:DHA2 family multidrug resistance protein-like MFS transporter n=1 Tax=Pseudorhodoferax soli TaxID=545864 RepID=A0A368XIR6_9BURK|nr:MFS transporter [Pseudorhodoferax soli]RCW67489.1 DHA2 family multidrug resistance protein-like MFS transporter [Pseudorhodoferax soli]